MTLPDPLPFVLVVARLSGLVLAAPILGHGLVPARVRAGLIGVLALALVPNVPAARLDAAASPWLLAGLVAIEGAIGMAIGFLAQLVFAGVQLGGQVAGIQVGFGIANVIDPSSETGATVMAQWQQFVALLAFLALDVHHVVLRAVIDSFEAAPVGAVVLSQDLFAGIVAHGASLFAIGVRIAAPVLVVLLLVNGALAVLARTIPQLNVFAVGFPVNVGAGLIVVGASLPFTMRFLAGRFAELDGVLGGFVEALGALARG